MYSYTHPASIAAEAAQYERTEFIQKHIIMLPARLLLLLQLKLF